MIVLVQTLFQPENLPVATTIYHGLVHLEGDDGVIDVLISFHGIIFIL